MTPDFVFNCRFYKKNSTKTNVTYYKCSNWDRGCPARLMVRNNEISEKGTHNCEANRLGIQIPAINLTHESFVNTFILEKASQLNLYPNQIFRGLLLNMRNQFVKIPEHRGLLRINSIEAAMSPPLSLLPNNQPFFRRYWVGDINGD
ncbi:hypothetical protein HZS_1078 [Henneguya salminicola]|nr:hypothetical protein HZS_1078 [Henneguya salminicola]